MASERPCPAATASTSDLMGSKFVSMMSRMRRTNRLRSATSLRSSRIGCPAGMELRLAAIVLNHPGASSAAGVGRGSSETGSGSI